MGKKNYREVFSSSDQWLWQGDHRNSWGKRKAMKVYDIRMNLSTGKRSRVLS